MKNKTACYNPSDVKKYGIYPALIIGRIRHWCYYNKKSNAHFHDGYHWSGYLSARELSEQTGVPEKTIDKHLRDLVTKQILFKANYNKKSYDRTGWYRINPNPPIEDTIPPIEVTHPLIEGTIPVLEGTIPVNPPVNHTCKSSGNLDTGTSILGNTGNKLLDNMINQIKIKVDSEISLNEEEQRIAQLYSIL